MQTAIINLHRFKREREREDESQAIMLAFVDPKVRTGESSFPAFRWVRTFAIPFSGEKFPMSAFCLPWPAAPSSLQYFKALIK